ncbi:hypothetical protein P8C59_000468 [Phyllachora maydis]|uniref:Uncharacterized protein n=1 Tax=Phyllachora maydis TaxID=1825666 RepID=A0AAD9M8W0_9PEZI|nr:hypothetical protein P8C59_000468 [Phyllachora maydis]
MAIFSGIELDVDVIAACLPACLPTTTPTTTMMRQYTGPPDKPASDDASSANSRACLAVDGPGPARASYLDLASQIPELESTELKSIRSYS